MKDSLPLSQLHLESFDFENPRSSSGLDDESIQALADDIKTRGLLYPLLVYKIDEEDYLVIGGQRRFRAIQKYALLKTVPVKILEGKTLEEARETALADNVHREQLSTFEIARAMFNMHSLSTVREIAAKVNLSYSYVARLILAWRNSCPELKEAWRNKTLTDNEVVELAMYAPGEQVEALSKKRSTTPSPTKKNPRKNSEHKRGPKSSHGRPSVAILRKLLEVIREAPHDSYQGGMYDMLQYVLEGTQSTDPRWSEYTSFHAQRFDPNRGPSSPNSHSSPDGTSPLASPQAFDNDRG